MRTDSAAPRRAARLALRCGAAALLTACARPAADAALGPDDVAVRRWLLCEECVHGELHAIRDPARQDRVVPLLALALAGPPRGRRENVRRQLEETYQRLATRAGERGETLPLTREQYVAHYLGNYEALYQSRAVIGLRAIGTPEAQRVLAEARDRVRTGEAVYRGDVIEELTRATGSAAVGGSALWTSVTAGSRHSCGTRTDGQTYCWGQNDLGQLGDSTTTGRTRPGRVAAKLKFSSIMAAAGGHHTCAIAEERVYCWGNNANGELGDSSNTNRIIPTPVRGGVAFAGVAVGAAHSCAWSPDGTGYCWGLNSAGQLGDGTTTGRNWPSPAADSLRFRSLGAGGAHTCGASVDGRPSCWGSNEDGQLGDGSHADRPVPGEMLPPLRLASLSLGSSQTCGLTLGGPVSRDGIAHCVGLNDEGQLGDGTATSRDSLRLVAGSDRYLAISTGARHTCGITGTGSMRCWGDNSFGQLGDGTSTEQIAPVLVEGGLSFAVVSAGEAHTCAVTVQGTAYCWGLNMAGQLGDGTDNNRPTPTKVLTP